MVLLVPQAHARSNYLSVWSTVVFPDSNSDGSAGCDLCHGGQNGFVNGYGLDIRAQLGGAINVDNATIQAAIIAVNGLNSDGDTSGAGNTGFNNEAEANADAQPGWTTGNNDIFDTRTGAPAGTETADGAGVSPPLDPGDQPPPPPPGGECEGIAIANAEWRASGNGSLRVSGTGERNGDFVLSNALDLNQTIDIDNGRNGRFSFNVNGNNFVPGVFPVPCRVRVEQPDLQLCGEADVVNPPADCAPPLPPPPREEPIARGDSYTTVRGEELTVPATRLSGVLYNDFDETPTGTLEAVNLDITGTQGTVTLNTDGSFTYTPPLNAPLGGAAYLDDQFTYQATDGINLSEVATVNVRTLPKQTDFKFMMNYELGMHCTGFEFAYCCVLPAYNSIITQIAKPAIGDPAASPCFDEDCNAEEAVFVDGFPRLLEGDPARGGNLDVLGRETVVRDPALDGAGNFKKYVVKYWHDSQSRNEGQGKPQIGNPALQATLPPHLNTHTLVSDVEGNSLLSWNTRADAADRNADGSFVIGPAECSDPLDDTTCAATGVVQGNGDFGDTGGTFGAPVDNYQNAVWNHLYIYADTEGTLLGSCTPLPANLDDRTRCSSDADCAGAEVCEFTVEIDKARLGLDVDYPTNFGPAGHPMGPVSGGTYFEDNPFGAHMTFSEDTGTVVYTQMKLVENLPVMLTSPRIWEALGLPLTPFEDTIGFFADPGAVDEDSIRPYVQMSAQLHEAVCDDAPTTNPPIGNLPPVTTINCTAGPAVLGAGDHPVQGFGDAPIDIPNCERCHSAPPTDADGNLNVNSPNIDDAQNALVTLEYDFWAAYYDLDPLVAGDSDWYARLKGAAISILSIHDDQHGTQFTANFPAVSPIQPASDPFNAAIELGGLNEPFIGSPAFCIASDKTPTGPSCTSHADCAGFGDEICDLPQNTRIGHESVICQKCHADNVIAVVKSTNCGPAGTSAPGVPCFDEVTQTGNLIPALTQAIHYNHRSVSEDGFISFNDALGRDGGCQGCHPAHRSDGVMDGYPIDLDGNNAQEFGDNRLAQGGCFVGRDVHSNPMKDVDGAETPEHLNALGQYLSDFVFNNQGGEPGGTEDVRGVWCTNCHSQVGQQMWKAENCTDLINNECEQGENPRAANNMNALAAALGTSLIQLESWADPKDPAVDPDLPLSGPGTRPADDTHFIWNPDAGLCNYVDQWLAAGQSLPPGGIDPEYDGPVALVEVAVPALGGAAETCQTTDVLRDGNGDPVSLCTELAALGGDGFQICGSYDADGDFTAALTAPPGDSPFCTTQDCKEAADAILNAGHVTAQIPFSTSDITTASDGRDHWLAAGEPHCADCHKAPYTEQSGNINAFPPFNYPRRASLMRYSRGHQDVTCQGCHESIHGLYPVTPTIDNTTYAQAAALNNDGSHGPLKCESCHTHVNAAGVPNWVDDLTYSDPIQGGNVSVQNNFDAAVSWAHTYTDEANPLDDVCRNCHGNFANQIADDEEEWLVHAMANRVSRIAMDDAEIAALGAVSGATDPLNTVCLGCHGNENDEVSCVGEDGEEWKRHLIEGRVAESVWEEVSLELTETTCGW